MKSIFGFHQLLTKYTIWTKVLDQQQKLFDNGSLVYLISLCRWCSMITIKMLVQHQNCVVQSQHCNLGEIKISSGLHLSFYEFSKFEIANCEDNLFLIPTLQLFSSCTPFDFGSFYTPLCYHLCSLDNQGSLGPS